MLLYEVLVLWKKLKKRSFAKKKKNMNISQRNLLQYNIGITPPSSLTYYSKSPLL